MPRPKKNYDRVIGCYGKRLITFVDGERIVEFFASESRAKEKEAEYRRLFTLDALTLAGACCEWIATKAVTDDSRDNYRRWLVSFFGEQLHEPPTALTPAWCRARYAQLTGQYAAATHHSYLETAQEMLAWCVKRGWLERSPAEGIETVGSPNRGKPQLTLDEARALMGACFAEITNPRMGRREEALVIVSCLYLGTRISEVLRRVARDLDDRGTVLRIPFGKSPNAIRRLKLPEEIQPYWQEKAKHKTPTAPLFGVSRTNMSYWMSEFCSLARVPRVCVHSLRGLHAALAVEGGAKTSAVASMLGHTEQMMRRHYVPLGVIEQVQADRVVALFRT